MKAKIIKIGNSRGLRLPRTVIEQVGIGEEVELEAAKGSLIVRPISGIRASWAGDFSRMAKKGDDVLLDREASARSSWDDEEWKWK